MILDRNLPEGAIDWGREVDARSRAAEIAALKTNQSNSNTLRAVAGNLSVLTNQIDILQSKQSRVLTLEQMSKTASMAPFTEITSIGRVEHVFNMNLASQYFEDYVVIINFDYLTQGAGTSYHYVDATTENAQFKTGGFSGATWSGPTDWTLTSTIILPGKPNGFQGKLVLGVDSRPQNSTPNTVTATVGIKNITVSFVSY